MFIKKLQIRSLWNLHSQNYWDSSILRQEESFENFNALLGKNIAHKSTGPLYMKLIKKYSFALRKLF